MSYRFRPLRAGLLPLFAAASPAVAQDHDEQLWLQVNTNVALTDDTRVTLEQIGRFGDEAGGLYQTEFGAIVSHRIAKGIELGFGYRKVGFHNGNAGPAEDRIRQHLVGSFGRFATRFRVDERFFPGSDEIGVRIRPLIRYNLPLGTRKGFAAFYSHESFYLPNSTSWGQRSGYERMRNIVGLQIPIGSKLSLDAGYLNQFRPGQGGRRDRMEHALTLQLTINALGPILND